MSPHPTRTKPQVKPISPELGQFKTLARVARFRGSEDVGLAAGLEEALRLLPWIPEHFAELRGHAPTRKELAGTVAKALERYRREYRATLSRGKREECEVADRLLARGLPVSREDFAEIRRQPMPGAGSPSLSDCTECP